MQSIAAVAMTLAHSKLLMHRRPKVKMLCSLLMTSGVLQESRLFSVAIERRLNHLPILTLRARTKGALDMETARSILDTSAKFLNTNEEFNSLWDIREASVPSVEVTWACINWVVKKTKQLRKQNKRMAVLVPDSPPLRRIAQLALKVAAVRCPSLITANETEALAFIDAHSGSSVGVP
tara:strand:- start:1602 stop:2138 length:537 start_codon:yes stop_codon:yes gene_type:complete